MREKELLKVALQGDFYVIKICKTEEGVYVLKQMCASQTPSWCIIEKSSKLSDIEFCISIMRHSSKYILNASERIKVSDLINLSEAGFQVIRISPLDKLVVKKFNPLTKSWIKLSSFPKVCLRENFLSEKLCNRDTVMLNLSCKKRPPLIGGLFYSCCFQVIIPIFLLWKLSILNPVSCIF